MFYVIAISVWIVVMLALSSLLIFKRWEDPNAVKKYVGLCALAFFGAVVIGALSTTFG